MVVRSAKPPKSNRVEPWEQDRELYKERNAVECNFRFIKQFYRVAARDDKPDATCNAFVAVANILRTA